MEFVKKSISTWIVAAIILVVGILCIVAGAQIGNSSLAELGDTSKAISLTLGISFIVVGSLGIILALVGSLLAKKGFAAGVGVAGVVLAVGIWLVVTKSAGTLIGLLLSFVPYVLVVVGGVMVIDSTFKLVDGIKAKEVKKALPAVIVGYVVAAIAVVMGALCLADVIKGNVQLIIFGILVAVYAVFMVLGTFVNIPTTVVVVKEEVKAE
mgnify:CR=1 FL=1